MTKDASSKKLVKLVTLIKKQVPQKDLLREDEDEVVGKEKDVGEEKDVGKEKDVERSQHLRVPKPIPSQTYPSQNVKLLAMIKRSEIRKMRKRKGVVGARHQRLTLCQNMPKLLKRPPKTPNVAEESPSSSTSKRRHVAKVPKKETKGGVKKDLKPKAKAKAKAVTKVPGVHKALLSRKSSAYHSARREALAEGLSPTKAKARAKAVPRLINALNLQTWILLDMIRPMDHKLLKVTTPYLFDCTL